MALHHLPSSIVFLDGDLFPSSFCGEACSTPLLGSAVVGFAPAGCISYIESPRSPYHRCHECRYEFDDSGVQHIRVVVCIVDGVCLLCRRLALCYCSFYWLLLLLSPLCCCCRRHRRCWWCVVIALLLPVLVELRVARAQSLLSLFWSFGCRPARSRTPPTIRLHRLLCDFAPRISERIWQISCLEA